MIQKKVIYSKRERDKSFKIRFFSMSDNIFEPFDPVRFGWNTLKSNPQFFAVLMVIVAALYYIPSVIQIGFLSNAVSTPKASYLETIAILLAIIYLLIYQIVELGLLGIALGFRDGKSHEIGDLFKNLRLFPSFFAATIIYGLMVTVGLFLLVVPGIYLALKYQFYGYLIVDKGLGAVEALRESGRITEGAKKDILIFWLTLGCSMAVIMLLLGVFIAIPAGFITATISKNLVPSFILASNLVSMAIKLMIVVPITKLATADVYRILQVRLTSSAAALPLEPAPVEG
jgi:uncharacterized membrane protein